MSNGSGIVISEYVMKKCIDDIQVSTNNIIDIFNDMNRIIERLTDNHVWYGLSRDKFVEKYNKLNKNYPKVVEKLKEYIIFLDGAAESYKYVDKKENEFIGNNASDLDVSSIKNSVSSFLFDDNSSVEKEGLANINKMCETSNLKIDDFNINGLELLKNINEQTTSNFSFDDKYDAEKLNLEKSNGEVDENSSFDGEYDVDKLELEKLNNDDIENLNFEDKYNVKKENIYDIKENSHDLENSDGDE